MGSSFSSCPAAPSAGATEPSPAAGMLTCPCAESARACWEQLLPCGLGEDRKAGAARGRPSQRSGRCDLRPEELENEDQGGGRTVFAPFASQGFQAVTGRVRMPL